jgi:uncharacterized protein YlxW (UPF0749 family)
MPAGLLSRIAADALDPGYRAATRPDGARSPLRRAGRLGTVLALLGVGALFAMTAHAHRAGAPARARITAVLTAERDARAAGNRALDDQIGPLRSANATARAQASAADRDGTALAGRIDALAPAAAARAASGPGLRIVIVDAGAAGAGSAGTGPRGAGTPVAGRLADHDLAEVVNALWSGHATAIAVNGRRLSARSAIRTAGEAILVGFEPVVSPYTIDAVGDPAALAAAFAGSGVGRGLAAGQIEGANLRSSSLMRTVTLPAADVPVPRVARGLNP